MAEPDRPLDDAATQRELADPEERVNPLPWFFIMSVSYTHLTLPTNREV